MRFSLGEKVRVVQPFEGAEEGAEGIVRGEHVLRAYTLVALEMTKWKRSSGHFCDVGRMNLVPSGRGYWVRENCLELVRPLTPFEQDVTAYIKQAKAELGI